MGLDKNQLKLATEPLLWNYCENSTKMIIFKLISIGIKQNLGLWCSKFYSRGQNKIIIIIIIKFIYNFWFLAKSGGSFEPSRLAIELSLYMCVCVCVCVCVKIIQLILNVSIVKILVWKPNSFLVFLFILITLVVLHKKHVLNYTRNI